MKLRPKPKEDYSDLVDDDDFDKAWSKDQRYETFTPDPIPGVPRQILKIQIPKRLGFLLEMHRFKVLYGGRGGGKSWAVADCLLILGSASKLRILCTREIQDSIKQSVYKLLCDRIEELGLGAFYQILDKEIRGANGTEITFTGLGYHTTESIKSYEGVDIVWVEEAQTVSERSWSILTPTIRAKGSEIWVTFNPDMETDPCWQRFIVHPPTDEPPFDCVVEKMNWSDNPWFPEVLERDRRHCKLVAPDEYDNIWEGKCRASLLGAIYAREINDMVEQRRIRAMPYDPRIPVHCVWDLGWNDAMTVVMCQKPLPSVVNIINYYEDSFQRYDEVVRDLNRLGYRYGYDWLPHDARNANPQTGVSPWITLVRLGRKVKQPMERTDPERRIKAARMLFPRLYIDDTDKSKTRETGWLGPARLIECIKRYRRNIPKTTGEPGDPKHDEFSHGCDALGALAEIVDQIVNDTGAMGQDDTVVDPFENIDPSMGMLG
jgi:phage terminase large subunit